MDGVETSDATWADVDVKDEEAMSRLSWDERLDARVLAPAHPGGARYRLFIVVLGTIVAWGFVAFVYQLKDGLYVTDMRDRISWGLYIAALIFFMGISMAGTFISAILRAASADWRTPITRMAEAVTVAALISGALFIIVDMGRPDRLYNFYFYGNWQSPMMWDMIAITIYLTASVTFLLVPMVPDLAYFRDRLNGRVARWRILVYDSLALGWEGNERQHREIHKAIGVLMIVIIPVAASVHTMLAWIFATTSRVSWDSTILGLFFVTGAMYSGIATVIILLAVVRRVYHLEEYITPRHFKNLAYLMAAGAVLMLYGNASEYIPKGFKMDEEEAHAFRQLFVEDFAPFFWFYFFGGLVFPVLVIAFKRTRTIPGLVIASIFVNVGMFIERYFIVVAGLRVPLLDYEPSSYSPTWVEWSIFASGCAGFTLLITLFTRVFPILSVWEMKEEHEYGEPSPVPVEEGSPA